MNSAAVIRILSALAQEHRLAAFRLLVQAGAEGLPAGQIAEALKIAPSSVTFHLGQLVNAGLASHSRHGRSIRYAPDYQAVGTLVSYLIENCSNGEGCGEVPGCGAGAPPLPAFCAASASANALGG